MLAIPMITSGPGTQTDDAADERRSAAMLDEPLQPVLSPRPLHRGFPTLSIALVSRVHTAKRERDDERDRAENDVHPRGSWQPRPAGRQRTVLKREHQRRADAHRGDEPHHRKPDQNLRRPARLRRDHRQPRAEAARTSSRAPTRMSSRANWDYSSSGGVATADQIERSASRGRLRGRVRVPSCPTLKWALWLPRGRWRQVTAGPVSTAQGEASEGKT